MPGASERAVSGDNLAHQEGNAASAVAPMLGSPSRLPPSEAVHPPVDKDLYAGSVNTMRGASLPVPTRQEGNAASVSTDEQMPVVADRLGFTVGIFCLAWGVVSSALLFRLAGAWRQLSRIRRSAAEADTATIETCLEVATILEVAAPDVKHSPYLASPCLAGLRKPVVLLPEGFQAMSVRNVLIHELAHLRRRDCHWSLLVRVATAAFFF